MSGLVLSVAIYAGFVGSVVTCVTDRIDGPVILVIRDCNGSGSFRLMVNAERSASFGVLDWGRPGSDGFDIGPTLRKIGYVRGSPLVIRVVPEKDSRMTFGSILIVKP